MAPAAPRFAAIIPLYNKAATITDAIASVIAQTWPAAEIVVVDDASTDGGAERVAAYGDPRIQLLTRPNPGPGGYAARNLAIAATRSDWIAFLDADDRWHPGHLATLAEGIAALPEAGCVTTRYDHVFVRHREPDRVAQSLAAARRPQRLDLTSFLEAWLAAGDCPIWTGAVSIRRDVLERTGGFPEGRAARGGDKDLWLRVAAATPIVFVPRPTADFSRDASDKLTRRVDTRSLPCLVPTARWLTGTVPPRDRRLLRRLVNQEIELYARATASIGGGCRIRLRDLRLPVRARTVATLLAARYLPSRWLISAHGVVQRRRATTRKIRERIDAR